MKSFFLCLCAPKNYHLADLQNRTIIPRLVLALVLSCHSSFMIFIKITIIYYLLLFVNKYQNFTKQKVFFFSQILSPNMKHKELGKKEFSFFRMAFIYATSLKYFFEHTTKLTMRCSHLPLYTNITTDLCCLPLVYTF